VNKHIRGMTACLLFGLLGLVNPSIAVQSDSDPYLSARVFLEFNSALKKFGTQPFNMKFFPTAPLKIKAAMAVDLMKSRTWVGKPAVDVQKSLGKNTGHFWSATVPAYIIQEGWNEKKDTWQLVFLIDKRGIVSDIRIHRNCCL